MPPARQIILFVVDGLRPDALEHASTPHLDRLITQGAYTWKAQSVQPSVTLPCHASLFYGVTPERHGIVSNQWTQPQPPVPSLIEVVHQAGLNTAAFYTWEELRDLSTPGMMDFAYFHRLGDPEEEQRDTEIATVARDYIGEQRPGLVFVYIEVPDLIGHRHGWMSGPYLRAVSRADTAIGLVLEGQRASRRLADTVCLVLADHGGHDFDHDREQAEDLTIPWIISGPGIRKRHQIAGPVNIIDTAPTIAHLLDLSAPTEWAGEVITEALTP